MHAAVPPSPRSDALPVVTPEILSACGQAIRRIRSTHAEARSTGVTSTARSEGRSTAAVGLTIALVRSLGRQAVLIDLDTDSWTTPAGEGYRGDTPSGPAGLMDAIEWTNPDLGILRLGRHLEASELTPARARSLIAEVLAHGYDVVADLSCLPPAGSGDQFAGLFDVVVLVVRAGASSADAIRGSAQMLANPPVVLLNRTHSSIPRWFRYGGR
ncbi:MAG: hypothetical protein WCF12_13155 [Propionicimonas sp.]